MENCQKIAPGPFLCAQIYLKLRNRSILPPSRCKFALLLLLFQGLVRGTIHHFRITAIWPGDRIRRPEHPTENEVRRRSCDESV